MKPNKRKLITTGGIVVIIIIAILFVFKNQIFADILSDSACTTDHPYIIKTGKQAYMSGATQVLNPSAPGVPKNYLIRIDRSDAKTALGNYPDQKTIVCHKKSGILVQIPSYIDTSGEMLFQIQEDINQNSEVKYYISTTANVSSRLNLVQPSDIESHPFANAKAFNNTKTETYWKTAFLGGGSANFAPVNELSPGGSNTLLVKDFAQTAPDAKFNTRLYPDPSFSYDPAIDQTKKGTYIIGMGWVKYKNLKVDEDQESVPLDTRYGAKVTSNIITNGVWDGHAQILVNSNVNSEWVRYFYPEPLSDEKINYSFSFETANISSGEISYSDFKLIKNIKSPRTIANWSNGNVVSYFDKPMINPQSSISYPGASFNVDQNTKLYLTDNFSDYYKDHFDEGELVLTDKLQATLKAKYGAVINPSEIKDFKAEKSIIIGDLTNTTFKAFAYKLRPDLASINFKDEGFRLLVGEKYILVVGKDMTGSYYGALRLNDLIESSGSISQRIEEDYPDSSFRSILSFNIPQRIDKNEQGLSSVKKDIKNLSGLRYNIYQLSGPTQYENFGGNPSLKNFMSESYAYARKYFMEPLATSFSFSYPYGTVATNTSTRNLVYYEDREISFSSTSAQKSYQFASEYIRKYSDDLKTTTTAQADTDIPFLVKSADGSVTYKEGTDYVIEYRYVDPANEWKGKAYFIRITDNSAIKPIPDPPTNPPANPLTSSYKLKMTYNGDGELTYSKSSRLTSKRARELISSNLLNAINTLHPKYININNDEMPGIGMDYRDIYNPDGTRTNATPPSLLADAVQFQYDVIKKADPNIKVIMWSDMLNPYHRYGSGNFSVKPYTFSVSKLIPKDIILDEWFMMAGGSETCQQVTSAMNYHLKMGFKILASPLTTSSQEIYDCVDRVVKTNPSQFVGYNIPEWTDTHDDKPSAKLHSDQIWNSEKTQTFRSTATQTWQDGSFIVSSPTPTPSATRQPDTVIYNFAPGLSIIGTSFRFSASQITNNTGLTVQSYDAATKRWVANPGANLTIEPGKAFYVNNPAQVTKTVRIAGEIFPANVANPRLYRDGNFLFNNLPKDQILAQIYVDVYDGAKCLAKNVSLRQLKDSEYIAKRPYIIDSLSLIFTPTLSQASAAVGAVNSIPSKKGYWIFVKNNIANILKDTKYVGNRCN